MPLRRDALEARLAKMDEAVGVMGQLAAMPPEELQPGSPTAYALERSVDIAIECLLDIGNQVIADGGWGRPASYAEVIRILGQRGVLPREFAQSIVGMAGLRNILVHGYLDVDLPRLLELARRGSDFDAFACHVLRYLDRDRPGSET